MEKREDMWKSVLQEQFEHFEAETERDLWPAIEEKIERKKIPFYLWRSTWLVAASVTMLFAAIWVLQQPDSVKNGPIAGQTETSTTESISPVPQSSPPPPVLTELADVDLLPTSADPEVLQQLQALHNDGISPAGQEQISEPLVESSLPPNRIIRQVGPMQPLMPQNLQNFEERAPRPSQVVAARRQERQAPAPQGVNQITTGERQSLDLNNLTLGDAVSFASNELGKLVETPLEVYTEEVDGQEVRTYQLDLFNLKITRKTHRRSKS